MKTRPLWFIGLPLAAVPAIAFLTGCGAGRPGPQLEPSAVPLPRAAEPAAADPSAKLSETAAAKPPRVREPAVAGLFYPKDPAALSQMIDKFLTLAPQESLADLKAIICPHAGYVYSGPTAAYAYKLLAGRGFKHVLVLAPSHYASFPGASVCAADVFRTPLGDVPVSEKGQQLAKASPFVWEPRGVRPRPPWAAQSSRPLPAVGEDTPDTWEHSDEVQVPFLQRVLKNFKVLTIVLGDVDPAQVARGLAGVLDPQTLLIASSDLSHYHSYEQAKELDARCIKTICALDLEQMKEQEACGKLPILALLHLAKQNGWKAKMLDYRNSGDTAGDKSGGVVGYSAIAFYAPGQATYTPEEKKFLMDLAKKTVRDVVTKGELPPVDASGIAAKLKEPKGCFVTLTKQGRLRGCIGHIVPQEPLFQAIMDNARNAALRDSRFLPVRPEELSELEFEVSILTEPQALAFTSPEDLLAKLRPRIDGVVLRIGERSATFLPQVWEQLPDKSEFLNHLAQKAGANASDWRRPGTAVSTYQVEAFKESEL